MNYLTTEQVLFLHARLIEETGGAHGVRDLGLLLSAPGRPQATFEDRELYSDIFSKAAALMDSLICNHPFLDGNKRTGVAAAGLFLLRNGYRLNVSNASLEALALDIAQSKVAIEEMAVWLRENSQALRDLGT